MRTIIETFKIKAVEDVHRGAGIRAVEIGTVMSGRTVPETAHFAAAGSA